MQPSPDLLIPRTRIDLELSPANELKNRSRASTSRETANVPLDFFIICEEAGCIINDIEPTKADKEVNTLLNELCKEQLELEIEDRAQQIMDSDEDRKALADHFYQFVDGKLVYLEDIESLEICIGLLKRRDKIQIFGTDAEDILRLLDATEDEIKNWDLPNNSPDWINSRTPTNRSEENKTHLPPNRLGMNTNAWRIAAVLVDEIFKPVLKTNPHIDSILNWYIGGTNELQLQTSELETAELIRLAKDWGNLLDVRFNFFDKRDSTPVMAKKVFEQVLDCEVELETNEGDLVSIKKELIKEYKAAKKITGTKVNDNINKIKGLIKLKIKDRQKLTTLEKEYIARTNPLLVIRQREIRSAYYTNLIEDIIYRRQTSLSRRVIKD